MTYPITPSPSIHTYPPGFTSVPPSPNILGGLAGQFEQAIFAAFVKLLSQLPTIISQQAQALLQGLFNNLLPSAVDNLDGTALNIANQITTNLDGTANLISQFGQSPLNTLIDEADGTVQSIGANLNNLTSAIGRSGYAINNWATTLGNAGLSTANDFTRSLTGLIPSALDNLDGTATQTAVANIVQNLDGTATLASQVGSSAISQLMDHLDGTVMSLAHSWQNAMGGAQKAGGVNNITAAMAALQRTAVGTGSEFTSSPVNASVLFNQYSNSSGLP